jgi:hypothetical protein
MRLGYAVAASACVPGIFEPLSLANLYERVAHDASGKVRPLTPRPKNSTEGTITLRAPKRSTSLAISGRIPLVTRTDRENATEIWARLQPNSWPSALRNTPKVKPMIGPGP